MCRNDYPTADKDILHIHADGRLVYILQEHSITLLFALTGKSGNPLPGTATGTALRAAKLCPIPCTFITESATNASTTAAKLRTAASITKVNTLCRHRPNRWYGYAAHEECQQQMQPIGCIFSAIMHGFL